VTAVAGIGDDADQRGADLLTDRREHRGQGMAVIALLWQFCQIFLENHALAHAQRNDVSH